MTSGHLKYDLVLTTAASFTGIAEYFLNSIQIVN